ncbi:PREDICTED: probable glycosyltransferase At3g42180, partial [Populus euphratica]|uniref:Probable glycosyltransferase At3g42180 n=1 Tax=Populus euphratica TaxID=75702 RepID=A0AAJ6U5D7_POPEU
SRPAILDAYENELYGSKFCICPRGNNHVGGVCLTESMTFGCVPVILHDYYDFPFNDVLDWNNFSVILKEEHVPDLEKILKGIPKEKYKKMHRNLLQVRKHFQWNSLPVKYDLFRMIMYELWLRRHIIKY